MLNDWNEKESKRAESTWGFTKPQFLKDAYNFATNTGQSYLDLGCGFGRFLEFITTNIDEPNYIGYDSSESMISRIRERFPDFIISTFLRDITEPISHPQESIISSAVFIHLTIKDQQTILNNILKLRPLPKSITFDINSPSETEIDRLNFEQTIHYERQIKISRSGNATFRMTWQSHYAMTEQVLKLFPNYNLTIKLYNLNQNKHKVLYMLEQR